MSFIPALPTLPLRSLLPSLAPDRAPAFPLDQLSRSDGTTRLYYLARNGVYHGLRALGLRPGDAVLMPSYHHGVEVEAVRHAGATVVFYRVDEKMRADLDDVATRARLHPRARVLYLTHVAGWPQAVDDALALCRQLRLLLVEDCALSLFSRTADGRWLGGSGDLSIFCLYKTLPVPHGGVAIARGRWLPEAAAPPLLSTLHHVAGATLARAAYVGGSPGQTLRHVVRAAERRSVDRLMRPVQVGTQHLDPSTLHLGASSLVSRILARSDARMVTVRRRRNFARLLDALGDDRRVAPGPPPPHAAPLFFPLTVDSRRAALEMFWARGIEAIDFWSGGDPACTSADFPEAAHLRRHVIELPIHQDLDDEAIDVVARGMKDVLQHA